MIQNILDSFEHFKAVGVLHNHEIYIPDHQDDAYVYPRRCQTFPGFFSRMQSASQIGTVRLGLNQASHTISPVTPLLSWTTHPITLWLPIEFPNT